MSNNSYEGVLMVRGKGTGFMVVPGMEEDILISPEKLEFGLDGDLVEIELLPRVPGKRQEGKVVRVIEASHSEFIGVVKERMDGARKELFLEPDNRRIHKDIVLKEASAELLGMKAVAKITRWSDATRDPLGVVTEVLGHAGDHETEMQAIIRGGGFSESFPEPVARAAKEMYDQKSAIFDAAKQDPKRRDMRGITTFTIDPKDAKDFDDALSIQKLSDGNFEIGVHIADVSHYVREGEVIDDEAQKRGTSIYLVDRVIPMLPEVLSNDLCSLRPEEERLAFSAIFTLTPSAEVVNEWYGQTIIRSDRRFSYEEAQEILDQGQGDFHSELTDMMTLGRIIRKKRFAEGAIAFEQPEVKFELDESGKPIRAYTKVRTETMLMIEDFMLLANQSVATFIYKLSKQNDRDAAFVYRIHDVPNPEKIEELASFLRVLGYELRTEKGMVNAKDINKLLKEVEGKPEEALIKTATIRSMAKAVYSTKNIGHFGLAFKYYTHFTSPIRRYPDLMAHRLLRRHLDGSEIKGQELAKFEKLSVQSSEREIDAVRAERDSIKFKQVEFMAPHVGEEFNGVITGVTDWGIYVEEKESKSEGMVRLASIRGDYFEHLASAYAVKGQRTGKVYRLGDPVRFKVMNANLEEKQLDYELIG
ncbi:ribonuclease R [Candidatus Kaiserbacteria bacterium RIFCSPHIGHO2_01_FULL_46_22]|uniref:Ribonuclease R n=1 Tax=Candidatus Kaiserbacteria bacterium RIFCSPHIGHO2_01_FULL_46_22 TaxID=1798475 RepID=A0A1F6BZT6_9BACT|nr:MAG: ribonuclease R [Candidatus Kaiserbacteria bacterium RIFCSPHIGHO2_01_FULL_46_22]